LEAAVLICDGQVTTTDVKKATELLTKAGLMRSSGANEEGEILWEVTPVPESEMLQAIDRAMTVRLLSGLKDAGIKLENEQLRPLLLSELSGEDVDKLIVEAKKIYRNPSDQDG
jgi:hypothetical protein